MNDMGHDNFYTCEVCRVRYKSDEKLTVCGQCADIQNDWSAWGSFGVDTVDRGDEKAHSHEIPAKPL